jgi:hypothetical protein
LATNEVKRNSVVSIDLLGYKKPWLDWCRANDTTSSAAFRQIAANLTSQVSGTQHLAVVLDSPEKGTVKKKISLTPSEAKHAETLAHLEGFSLPKWIVATIRARLTATPQFGQLDIEVLSQSNLRLLAIGRNLNQIAKALNTSPQDRSVYNVEAIEEVRAMIAVHTSHVSAALSANAKRWRVE